MDFDDEVHLVDNFVESQTEDDIDSDVEGRLYASIHYSDNLLTNQPESEEFTCHGSVTDIISSWQGLAQKLNSTTETENNSETDNITVQPLDSTIKSVQGKVPSIGDQNQRAKSHPPTNHTNGNTSESISAGIQEESSVPTNHLPNTNENISRNSRKSLQNSIIDISPNVEQPARDVCLSGIPNIATSARNNPCNDETATNWNANAANTTINQRKEKKDVTSRKSTLTNPESCTKQTIACKEAAKRALPNESPPNNNYIQNDQTRSTSLSASPNEKIKPRKASRCVRNDLKQLLDNTKDLLKAELFVEVSSDEESIYTVANKQYGGKENSRLEKIFAHKNIHEDVITIDDSDDDTTGHRVSDSDDSEDSIYEIPVPPKPQPPTIDLDDSEKESDQNVGVDKLSPEKLVKTYKTTVAQSLAPLVATDTLSNQILTNCSEIQRTATSLAEIRQMQNANVSSTNNEHHDIQIRDENSNARPEMEINPLHCTNNTETCPSPNIFVNSEESITDRVQHMNVSETVDETCSPGSSVLPKDIPENRLRVNMDGTETNEDAEDTSDDRNLSDIPSSRKQGPSNSEDILESTGLLLNIEANNRYSVESQFTMLNMVSKNRKRSFPANEKSSKRTKSIKQAENSKDQTACMAGTSEMTQEQIEGSSSSFSKYFFKPMNEELRDFYNKSWGGENYDLDSIRRAMPQDSRYWAILSSDLAGHQHSRPRYWVPGKCTNCKQPGHSRSTCPEKPKIPSCYMCGRKGHREPRCPHKMCLNCGKEQRNYVQMCKACWETKCNLCQASGHTSDRCPDLWRRYHQTTNSTEINVPQHSSTVMKPASRLSCCNCCKRGHDASTCKSLRWSPYFPTPAHVTNYTGGPIYQKHLRFDDRTESPTASYQNRNEYGQKQTPPSFDPLDSDDLVMLDTCGNSSSSRDRKRRKSETPKSKKRKKLNSHTTIDGSRKDSNFDISDMSVTVPIVDLSDSVDSNSFNEASTYGAEDVSTRTERQYIAEAVHDNRNTNQDLQDQRDDVDASNSNLDNSSRRSNSQKSTGNQSSYIDTGTERASAELGRDSHSGSILFHCESELNSDNDDIKSNIAVLNIPLHARESELLATTSSGNRFLRNLSQLTFMKLRIERFPDATVVLVVHCHKRLRFPLQRIINDWFNWPADERDRFVELNLPTKNVHLTKLLNKKLNELKEDLGDPIKLCDRIMSLKNELRYMQRQIGSGKKIGHSPKRERIVDELATSQCRLNMILFGQCKLGTNPKSVDILRNQLKTLRKRAKKRNVSLPRCTLISSTISTRYSPRTHQRTYKHCSAIIWHHRKILMRENQVIRKVVIHRVLHILNK